MINYDLLFMSQGIVDTIYSEDLQYSFDYYSKTALMPFMFMLWGLNASVFSPLAYKDENFLFFYPLYNPTWMQSLYTSGSFYIVYLLVWYARKILNHKFNETAYNVFVAGSMWAYLTHYFWIIVCVTYVVRPYKLDFAQAVPITLVLT